MLNDLQFGFRRGRSTIDAVHHPVSRVISNFYACENTTAMLCDLSKAFECVSHEIITVKLMYYHAVLEIRS